MNPPYPGKGAKSSGPQRCAEDYKDARGRVCRCKSRQSAIILGGGSEALSYSEQWLGRPKVSAQQCCRRLPFNGFFPSAGRCRLP